MNTGEKAKKNTWLPIAGLQIGLFILSWGGICSKLAGREEFLSFRFFLFYGLLILILFVYAIIWQQVLKSISLTVAYACKGVGIFYGLLWGALIFGEKIRPNMIVGALLVLTGTIFFLLDGASKARGTEKTKTEKAETEKTKTEKTKTEKAETGKTKTEKAETGKTTDAAEAPVGTGGKESGDE